MYLKHFHLHEEPFATTPDPKFLYKSKIHQQALDRIMTSVTSRRGINAIIGEPGLGKSMLIRTLLKGFSNKVRFAWIFNTTMTSRELLRYICRDFGFKPKGEDISDLLVELYTFLIHEYEAGNYTILIIDEAQNLKPEVLEEIRQLSNLETVSNKLLQVILSGQPQLDVYLNDPALIQLKQRISLKATLNRLDFENTQQYIHHRMAVAGATRDDIFTTAALEAVYEISDGIPRLVNQVCDNALLTAADEDLQQVDAALVMDLLHQGNVMSAPPAPAKAQPLQTPAPAAPPRADDEQKSDAGMKPADSTAPLPEAVAEIKSDAEIKKAESAAPAPEAPMAAWPQTPRQRERTEPVLELEIADGFDGLDLGRLSIN